jgi:hypothetical protein
MRRWGVSLATVLVTAALAVGPYFHWQTSAEDHSDHWFDCHTVPPARNPLPPMAQLSPAVGPSPAVPQIPAELPPLPADVDEESAIPPISPPIASVPAVPPVVSDAGHLAAVSQIPSPVEHVAELSEIPLPADPVPAGQSSLPTLEPVPAVPAYPPAVAPAPALQLPRSSSHVVIFPQNTLPVSRIPTLPALPPAGSDVLAVAQISPIIPPVPPLPKLLPMPAPAPSAVETPNFADETLTSLFDNLNHRGHFLVAAEGEYLLWFVKGNNATVPIATAGILGSGNTITSQLGDNDSSKGPTSGGRFTLGYWQFDDNPWAAQGTLRTFGIEARVFLVGNVAANVTADAAPDLFRPFYDLNDQVASGFPVSVPGLMAGEISAHGQFSMWGAEANVWKNAYYDKPGTTYAIDLMAGVRYLNADSELDINSLSTFSDTIPKTSPYASFAGNRLQVSDSFNMHNDFYGGQIGIGLKSWLIDCLTFEGSLRVAFGDTVQDATIAGSQVRTFANGTTAVSTGGLLALPSNIGTRHNSEFTQIPELQFKANCSVSKQITLSVGFTALYWNRVLRAPNQVDSTIDITQIPNFPTAAGVAPTGLGHPNLPFQQTDLWMLGISVGLEYRW